MATVIYQLSHIYMVNHIDMNIFVIMLTCWHYDINQPKKKFSLACHQGGCSTRLYHSLSTTVLRTAFKLGNAN